MKAFLEKIARIFFGKYYEFQHPESALRYLPITALLKEKKMEDSKILEVGSGSLGITPYLKKPVDGVDLDFSGPQTPLLTKIKGSSLDLPFRKNTYDVVICVDTLEHIENPDREKAVREILRVARNLSVIVVPAGHLSELQDKKLELHFRKVFGQKNNFLTEHVKNGLPATEEILVILDRVLARLGKKAKIKSRPLLNLQVREFLMKTWISKNRFIYYLYLKGYLLLLPLFVHANWGNCYRRMFVVEFTPLERES